MKSLFKLLLLLAVALPALAARLPDYYPAEIEMVGIVDSVDSVDSVDKANLTMVVNGKSFPVSPEALIHSLRERYTTIDAIRAGDKIAFRLQKYGDNRYMLIEIWLLPDDYQLQFGQIYTPRPIQALPV